MVYSIHSVLPRLVCFPTIYFLKFIFFIVLLLLVQKVVIPNKQSGAYVLFSSA